jgi:L-asparaginase II
MSYLPILEVYRGGVVESMHYGAFVVADGHGNVVQSWGSDQIVTFLRSSAKPFQLIPLIEAGGVERFGFEEEQLALMCASHSGSDRHVAVAASIQELIGISENDLVCGAQPPSDPEARNRLIREGLDPTPNRNNCSGKHSGMLALSILLEEPTQGYSQPEHPVQKLIFNTIAEMFELDPTEIAMGIDGCSVPTFAVPLKSAAIAFARFADPKLYSQARQRACLTLRNAMTGHPLMVAGRGRFDTQVMQLFDGAVLSKSGAEGFQAMAIAPGAITPDSPSLGIALKIADGDQGSRARAFLSLSILKQLGLLEYPLPEGVEELGSSEVHNWRNLSVGELKPVYEWKVPA